MDSILSKGAGKVKGVRARLDGLVGVFKTLVEQHGQVLMLLHRLQDRPEKKAALWPEIRRELLSHERAELREVFAMLRFHPLTRELAEFHAEEANELELLVDEIEASAGDVWRSLFDRLVRSIEQHVAIEEKEIFPKAQAALGAAMAKELDDRFRATQDRLAAAV